MSDHLRTRIASLALAALAIAVGAPTGLFGEVVINEIHYHPKSGLREDEFIELHNVGASPVDLSGWTFTDGVRYTIPSGTILPAGGYLVVTMDAERIRQKYGLPEGTVIGNYEGALSNGGERLELTDSAGRVADVVSYLDEYPWPEAADGTGPSLECVDPRQDNATPRNWLPSENSSWVPISAAGSATSTRLYLYLEGAGECLIDDLSISKDGSSENLFPEGGFEAGADGWTMTGTHAGSAVTDEGARSGAAALRIVATGAGLTADRSVYRDISALVVGEVYTLSFWAKAISGNASLVGRVSGGGIISRTDLQRLEGTPGRENSCRDDSLPPLIRRLGTAPAIPRSGEPVLLAAEVEDEDLVEVKGTYDPGTGPVEVVLRDDGLSGDGVAGDGLYAAAVPGYARGTIVDYRVEAVDAKGNRVETPTRRYPVAEPPGPSDLPIYRIFIRQADWDRLNANIWTEEYFPAVFVHGDEIFADAGLRFRGGRPRLFQKKSLKVSLRKTRQFEGRSVVNLNAAAMDDDYLTEPLAYWFYERAGVPASKTKFVRVDLNGDFWGLFIDVEQVNERYLENRAMDPDGALYKAVGVVGSLRKLDGILYQGQEYSYQSQYEKKTREDEPYDDLIDFIHRLHATPPAQMEAFLEENLEVEDYVNYLAVTNLLCVWDSIQHNFYFYRDTNRTGKWRVVPWDNDHAWGEWEWNYYYDATYHLYMGTTAQPFAGVWYTWSSLWTGVLNAPRFRTLYHQRLRELLNTLYAEGPLFRKIDELRASIESTVLLDEAKWPDAAEPLHAGPRRTMAQEIPLLKQNIARRRQYMAGVLGVTLRDVPAVPTFRRGDANGDGVADVADALTLLRFLFVGANDISCADGADFDDDGVLRIGDAIGLLRYLFQRGPAPPAPGALTCGEDPTPDDLDCDISGCE